MAVNCVANYNAGSNEILTGESLTRADTLTTGVEISSELCKDKLNVAEYRAIDDILFHNINSSVLLSDDTFLIAGRADHAGICVLLDQQGQIIQRYRIESPDSDQGATAIGAMRCGENIIAAVYEYEINTSFVALLNSDDVVITEKFSGHIERVAPLDDGLLLCGSYFEREKKEIS